MHQESQSFAGASILLVNDSLDSVSFEQTKNSNQSITHESNQTIMK